jgi:Zn-dependent M28 family amino/carboxypeptidase
LALTWPLHGGGSKSPKPAKAPPAAPAKKQGAIDKSKDAALPAVTVPAVNIAAEELRQHARALATLRQQPGLSESERAQRARQYIAEQLYETGLLPGGDGQHGIAGFSQALSLLSVRSQLRVAPQFRSTATTIPVRIAVALRELVLFSNVQKAELALQESELVFVGYGITAPERAWDDYKGTDLRGKIALILDGNPLGSEADKGKPGAAAHWQSKFAEALRRGAVGALLIHDSAQAAEPLARLRSYFGGERLLAASPADQPTLQVSGFVSDEAARRLLLAAGLELEKQQQAAQERDFTPTSLRVRMSVQLQNQVRSIDSANLVGILPGSEEALRSEAVVLTSHIDHLASAYDAEHPESPQPLPGVRDRVVGAAGLLAMARATRQLPPPKRSLIFAFVSGHGESFAGAQRLLKHLPQPAERVVAHINLDGLNVGDSRPEILQIGRGKSNLDEVIDALATAQKRYVIADTRPTRGIFYRSESVIFARAGIPVLFVAPPDLDGYLATDYLQGSDIFRESWTFTGGALDCALLYQVALWVGSARTLPQVASSDEFAARASAPASGASR